MMANAGDARRQWSKADLASRAKLERTSLTAVLGFLENREFLALLDDDDDDDNNNNNNNHDS
jgi:hypothetical protein